MPSEVDTLQGILHYLGLVELLTWAEYLREQNGQAKCAYEKAEVRDSTWPEGPTEEERQAHQGEAVYAYGVDSWKLGKAEIAPTVVYERKPTSQQLNKRRGILRRLLDAKKGFRAHAPPADRKVIQRRLKHFTIIVDPTLETYAECNIRRKIIYLHPAFFDLDPQKQIEIFYHEAVSHIA
ncbi:unnamed protein product, partial [marine sediment metagenome]